MGNGYRKVMMTMNRNYPDSYNAISRMRYALRNRDGLYLRKDRGKDHYAIVDEWGHVMGARAANLTLEDVAYYLAINAPSGRKAWLN
jgi:hypothetical protein